MHLVNPVNRANPVKHETASPYSVSLLSVCRYDLSQRATIILGSTDNREDAFTATRGNPGSMDHLHALFSGAAPGGLFVRPVYNRLDWAAQAGHSTRRRPSTFNSLLASNSRWQCWLRIGAKVSGTVALCLLANRGRLADLSYFNYQPVVAEVVYTYRSCFSKRSVLPVCHQ